MDFYVFESQAAAIKALQKIDSFLGLPRIADHTETWAEIRARIDGKFVFPVVDMDRFPGFNNEAFVQEFQSFFVVQTYHDSWFPVEVE